MSRRHSLPGLAAALVLAGCHGGSGSPSNTPAAPVRGQLVGSPTKVATYTTADLLTQLGVSGPGKYLLALSYSPICSIEVYHFQYQTVGAKQESTSASAALLVPVGLNSACSGSRPVVLYAHGTTADKTFNIANLTAANDTEGLILAAEFAAQGYIVIAPNYAGYDTSTLPYHPYLVADAQAKDMQDALVAATAALPVTTSPTVKGNGKLFVTGYSQGGFVAMATHRLLQAAGVTVTASAPMSGPYALAAFGDAIFMGAVSAGATLNVAFLVGSYQQAYSNLYSQPADVFEAAFAGNAASLLPSATPIATLYAGGQLPPQQLFNSTPPAPAYAALTPAMAPANLAPIFAQGFGANNLVTNAFRLAYLQDTAVDPDGGFPTLTTGLPPVSPANKFRQDLKTNDLRNWTPTSPVLLCGGDSDPTVFYLNTRLLQNYWNTHAPAAAVTVVNIDSSGDPYADLKAAFTAAKGLDAANAVAAGASDGGVLQVLKDYHATLVPPFCVSVVKRFFDTH